MVCFKACIRGCFLCSALLVTACGGGDGGAARGCDIPLNVAYVENEFLTEDLFVLGNHSASDTTLIHQDGNQGNTYDIDTIILSRTTHASGNSLALSYSVHATGAPTNDTYIAFYIDVDKNAATGQLIDDIGADAVILDQVAVLGVHAPLSVTLANYHIWNGTNWVAQTKLGTLSSSASYFHGCTLGLAVFVPLYTGLEDLYAMNVRGVMKLIRLVDADPNTPVAVAEIDSTVVFDFMVP